MQVLARRFAAPVFALALFSSAVLIFTLQPLFARMVTPLLGGSPAVWNTSMVFFQAALLVGYVYAHLLARLKDVRLQALIHALVLAIAWLALPVHVSMLFGEPDTNRPVIWLLGVLTVSVGAPFAAASATAPLLQAWFARTGREDASDPYYLYAASNLGSFVGLLAYPVIIEPLLGAHAQSQVWTAGYVIVAALIVAAGLVAVRARGVAAPTAPHLDAAPTWRKRFYWMAAAAVPSALTLGVTLHISTDVASAPMLWVIPLALYLATFIIAFMRNSERVRGLALFWHPIAMAILIASYYVTSNWLGSIAGILFGFFLSALICHLALASARPSADRLTEFYLFVSLGGVLGGAFAALLAPLIFNDVYEYPLALAAACLFRPRSDNSDSPRLLDATVGASGLLAVLALLMSKLAALDAALFAGAIGAALGIVAAGFGDERRPAAARYALFGISLALSLLSLWAVLHLRQQGDVFDHFASPGVERAELRAPWSLILLVLSFLMLTFCVHGTIQRRREGDTVIANYAYGAAIPAAMLLAMLSIIGSRLDATSMTMIAVLFCGIGLLFNRGRPAFMTGIVLVAFLAIFLKEDRGAPILDQQRTFFGVLRTRLYINDNGVPPERALLHGTTLHGAQVADPRYTRAPLTYYYPDTSLGEAITTSVRMHAHANVALIGLGTGSTSCLMRPGDNLTIFEIDPAVVRLSANHGSQFTFVRNCQPNARVSLGDARLQIAHEPDNSFNVIVVDAFSSDAIPAHLLTREAIALYLRKAAPDGIVILHLSNRNLALVSEAARVARDLNVPTLYRLSDSINLPYAQPYSGSAASTMIVARNPQTLGNFPQRFPWRVIVAPPGRGWSDDYINLPRALWEGALTRTLGDLGFPVAHSEECVLYPDTKGCGHSPTPDATTSPPPEPPGPPRGRQSPSAPSSSPSH
ncbi:MAG: fused MFS/spermidine synthase [Terricaulis sp.]